MLRLINNGTVIEMAFEIVPYRGVIKLFFNIVTEEDDVRRLLNYEMVVFEGGFTALIRKEDDTLEVAGPNIAFSTKVNVAIMRMALGPKKLEN